MRDISGVIRPNLLGVHVQATPTLIPHRSNITDISIGNQHILALSESGHLYSWGANPQSQLGDGSRSSPRFGQNNHIPCRVGGPKSIKGVFTGGYLSHSYDLLPPIYFSD